MSRETLDLMLALNQAKLETQVALQCAPLLAGLKAAHILTVPREQGGDVVKLFGKTPISCLALCRSGGKVVFLLYERGRLEACLRKPDVKKLMERFGYGRLTLKQTLRKVASRYGAHMQGQGSFPHEIGLLLGYPPEDVTGFIENQGENFLCVGYWKVYAAPEERRKTFESYGQAKDCVVRMVSGGMSLRGILEFYGRNPQQAAAG